MQFESDQERGGRKGGLPIREVTLFFKRTGLSVMLGDDEKVRLERLTTVVVKHLSAQPAIESQPSVLFGVVSFGWS